VSQLAERWRDARTALPANGKAAEALRAD
jgi:hypothetical protein